MHGSGASQNASSAASAEDPGRHQDLEMNEVEDHSRHIQAPVIPAENTIASSPTQSLHWYPRPAVLDDPSFIYQFVPFRALLIGEILLNLMPFSIMLFYSFLGLRNAGNIIFDNTYWVFIFVTTLVSFNFFIALVLVGVLGLFSCRRFLRRITLQAMISRLI